MPSYFSLLILLPLAWGLFAFGAVYDWAYTPLAWACAGVGALGLLAPGARPRNGIPVALAAALGLMLVAVFVQLAPLSPGAITRTSPATARFLEQFDVGYAVGSAQSTAISPGASDAVQASASGSYRHALSINPTATWLGISCLAAFGLLLLGTARALGRYSLRTLAGGIVILGFILAIAGIVQSGLNTRGVGTPQKLYGLWQPLNEGALPFGPFVNRNHFAGAMLLALPLALGYFSALVARGMRGVKPTFRDRVLWFSSPDASRVILVGLAIAVMGLSLVLTLSRSGITGFLVALAISAWFVVRRQVGRSTRAVSVIYLAALALLVLGWTGLDAIVSRFSTASSDFFGGRLIAWRDSWAIVKDFPLVGTGLNTYGYATLFYQTPGLPRHYVEAHNDYLQLLAEGGLLLAIPALLVLVLLAREIRLRFKEGQDDTTTYWVRVGATTGLIAIALQEVVEFSLQIPGIAALFAVVAGIAIHRPAPRTQLSGAGAGRDNGAPVESAGPDAASRRHLRVVSRP